MRKIFTLFAAIGMLCATMPVQAQSVQHDSHTGLYYVAINSNDAKIVAGDYSNLYEVEISDGKINGLNIVEIADGAFKNCQYLAVFDLEGTAEGFVVGEEAFAGCNSLEIAIINNCSVIKKKAFMGCTMIDGDGLYNVTTVGDSAFVGCTNFAVHWFTAGSDQTLTSIGAYAFAGTKFGLGNNAFLGSKNKSLHIGEHAFKDCSGAHEIFCKFATLTYDGDKSPLDDIKDSIQHISLSDNHQSIPAKFFAGLSNAVFTIANDAYLSNLTTIGDSAFAGCTTLNNAALNHIFGSKLATIGADAFSGCNAITTLTLPASVTTIGDRAFAGLSNLSQITANMATPPAINANVFNNCGNLGNIKLKVSNDNYDAYKAANVWKNFKVVRQSGLWEIAFSGHDVDHATIQVLNAATDEVLDEEQIPDGTTVKFVVTPDAGYHVRETPSAMQITEDKYINIDIYSLAYRQRFIAEKIKDSNNNYIEVGTIQYKKNGVDFETEGYTVYEYGTILQVTAVPKPGYIFSHWKEDNSTNQTRSFSFAYDFTNGYYYDYTFRYYAPDRTAIFIPDPTATSIDNATTSIKAVKRIVNGQMVIEKNGKLYNALGAEVR